MTTSFLKITYLYTILYVCSLLEFLLCPYRWRQQPILSCNLTSRKTLGIDTNKPVEQ